MSVRVADGVSVHDRVQIEAVKMVALSTGLRIADPVLDELGGPDRLTVHEYATTGGITLALPGGVLVNAPFDEPFCEASALRLEREGDGLCLLLDDMRVSVERVLPLPGYLDAQDEQGRPVSDTTMSHADRIRVSPIVGCAYDCRFCDLASARYRPRDPEQVLQGIDIALADAALPPRHLLISGGSPAKGERHQAYFEDACRQIVRHVRAATADWAEPFEVDVMMSARPDGPAFVDRMVDEGVTGFSLNVEVYDDAHAARGMPLKHRFARPHLEATIARAVERLGDAGGRVRSLIIPGLEPPEDTLRGIEWLASLGCSPVISPFRPARGTALARQAPVGPALLHDLLREARSIVARAGVPLGPRCVPCQHNTLAFPWDARNTV